MECCNPLEVDSFPFISNFHCIPFHIPFLIVHLKKDAGDICGGKKLDFWHICSLNEKAKKKKTPNIFPNLFKNWNLCTCVDLAVH